MKKVLSSILAGTMLIASIGTISVFADEPKTTMTAIVENVSAQEKKVEMSATEENAEISVTEEKVKASKPDKKSFFSKAMDYVVSRGESFTKEISEHPLKYAGIAAGAIATVVAGCLGYRYLVGSSAQIPAATLNSQTLLADNQQVITGHNSVGECALIDKTDVSNSGPAVLQTDSEICPLEEVVLFGPASAGKSTLVNQLTGSNFVQSETEGSTQSIQHADATIYGSSVRFFDTPGLHNGTKTPEEAAGIEQAMQMIGTSDTVLVTFNAQKPLEQQSTGEIIQALQDTYSPERRVVAIINRFDQQFNQINPESLKAFNIFDDIVVIPNMNNHDPLIVKKSFNILRDTLMSCNISGDQH